MVTMAAWLVLSGGRASCERIQPWVSVGNRLNVSGNHWDLTFRLFPLVRNRMHAQPQRIHEACSSQEKSAQSKTVNADGRPGEGGGEGVLRAKLGNQNGA